MKTGKVKSIGLSNFNLSRMSKLIEKTGIIPKVDIVEINPYNPQMDLVHYCHEMGITLQAFSPLGSGKAPYLMEDETVAIYSEILYVVNL